MEPVSLCDIEDLEDTPDFDEYALPDVFPFDAGKNYPVMKVMNMLPKEGTSQNLIHIIQCMFTFHNIKSKRGMIISSKTRLGEKHLCMVKKQPW